MSSAIGGYLAGRMRTKITGLHTNEVFFRDTAHGFLAWAFATLISATALASATAYLANGALAGLSGLSSQSAQAVDPAQIYVDKLFRTTTPAADNSAAVNAGNTAAQSNTSTEILRLWSLFPQRFRHPIERSHLPGAGSRSATGISQADAEKRVDQVVAEAKTDADNARRAAAHLSFWLTAALLFGAFSASLAAAEGGALRDGTWNDRVLMPRTHLS